MAQGWHIGRGMDSKMSTVPSAPAVKRRRVHYFSGFDPRGPGHYHRLCREEAAKPQPQGGALQVGGREKVSPVVSTWNVEWKADTAPTQGVQTQHVFMGWDDLIRAHWSRSPLVLARDFMQTYAHMFRHIGAGRVWRMYRPAFKAGILPLMVLFGPVLLALLLGAVLGPLGWAAGVVLALAVWWLGMRGGLFWLLR